MQTSYFLQIELNCIKRHSKTSLAAFTFMMLMRRSNKHFLKIARKTLQKCKNKKGTSVARVCGMINSLGVVFWNCASSSDSGGKARSYRCAWIDPSGYYIRVYNWRNRATLTTSILLVKSDICSYRHHHFRVRRHHF